MLPSALRGRPRRRPAGDLFTARTLADVAAIGLVQERLLRESRIHQAQLHPRVGSRIKIEYAKGAIVRQRGLTLDEAFALILQHASRANRQLVDVSHDIVVKRLTARDLVRLPRT